MSITQTSSGWGCSECGHHSAPLSLHFLQVGSPAWMHQHILLVLHCLQAEQPCVQALHTWVALHSLQVGQPHTCAQECPTIFTFSLERAALHAGATTFSWLLILSRWGSLVCTCSPVDALSGVLLHPLVQSPGWRDPIHACYDALLFLLDLTLEEVADDVLQQPCSSAREPG